MIKMWTTMDFARPLSCSKFKPSNSSCRQQKSFWLWILCWWSHSWHDTYKWKNIFGGIFKSTSPCPSCSSCHSAWDMQDVICTGQLFSRDLIWRDVMWNAFLWRFKLVSIAFYLWLRRFCNIHPPSLKLLPLMKVTTCRQRENKKFQYGSAQLSKSFYIQKRSLKSIL